MNEKMRLILGLHFIFIIELISRQKAEIVLTKLNIQSFDTYDILTLQSLNK